VFALPYYLRAAIAWGLIPLAFLSGVQAPLCRCASGEHRLFCPKLLGLETKSEPVATAHAGRDSSRKSCCAKRSTPSPAEPSCCANSGKPTGNADGIHTAPAVPCGECVSIPPSPPGLTKQVEAPTAEWTIGSTIDSSGDEIALLVRQGSMILLPASDRLPMTDRVIVLCQLLI
jgi:hypothetical protein